MGVSPAINRPFYGRNIIDMLTSIIVKHEGLRLKPYTDTTGNITIGVGRNLSTCGISQDEAYTMLTNDIAACTDQLKKYLWYVKLDDIRQGVLVELLFNVGLSSSLEFTDMILNLTLLNYANASYALLDSKWAKQVGPDRANNMAYRLHNGAYP